MIGKQIKEARKKIGLSQTELANKIGSYSHTISDIENGKVDSKWSTLEKIFKVLGMTINVL